MTTRQEAIETLRSDRRAITEVYDSIPHARRSEPGLGGGEWSPKDLLGHLESWEEHALEALDAWERGAIARISIDTEDVGTDEVNRRDVERKAEVTEAEAREASERTHRALLARLASLDDARWVSYPESQEAETVGEMLGSILGGPLGLFRHDPAHLEDLRAFAAG